MRGYSAGKFNAVVSAFVLGRRSLRGGKRAFLWLPRGTAYTLPYPLERPRELKSTGRPALLPKIAETRRAASISRARHSGFKTKAFLTKASTRSVTVYQKTQAIFVQGDPADAVFYIEKGTVKLTVFSDRGKAAVVAMLGRGDFFGEGCLAGQPLRMATASARSCAPVSRPSPLLGVACLVPARPRRV